MLNLNAHAVVSEHLRHRVTFRHTDSWLPSFELTLDRVPQQGEHIYIDRAPQAGPHAGGAYDGSWVVEQVQTDIALGENACAISYTVYLKGA